MRVTRCDIDPESLRCKRCGVHVTRPAVIRDCAGPGLGDRVASALSALGITKDRVSKLAGGGCGCAKRQAAMNAAGAKYLGLSPGSTTAENSG
jgi:hypothetical protein